VRSDLPSGTVTFLFTDVEGSTKLLHELGAEAYAEALAEHRRVIREACAAEDGVEVDTQGDAFFFAFPTAAGAIAAAAGFTDALAAGPIQVRVGLHTGTPLVTDEGYIGDDVHFGARVASSSHGGQVVVSAATAQLVELELSDLGEHRLKDIPEAVSIFQLGTGSFPPLKTISNTNLPSPASSFVGRDDELLEVLTRYEDGARLVTLTGPGGTGKTRLAIEAASELVPEFKAGVFWVGLATLRDPALVTETIAQTLGAKDGLPEYVGEREMLLLLDNLEQVIECAPDLSELLTACTNLTMLVTSRALLRIQGEVEYAVPPLAETEAVSLFCARAQLEPSEDVAELCGRLDNLPLAVELAAARANVLTPQQILGRLSQRLDLLKGGRDADPRQQTLRATIEWSYELLSPEEQQLFAHLSVFAGGCTLDAAEEVCHADLDVLQSLVEKSLVRFTNERYWMLETIREYATEQLEASDDADVRRAHAAWMLTLASEREATFGSGAAQRKFASEQDNFRAALEWAERSDEELQLDLIGQSWPFWWYRGHPAEGLRWAESALGRSVGARNARRAKVLAAGAMFTYRLGRLELTKAYASEGLEIAREVGDPRIVAWPLVFLGAIANEAGDYTGAKSFYEEARAVATEVGDRLLVSVVANNLGVVATSEGDFARAVSYSEEALAIARDLHTPDEISSYTVNLADSLCRAGRTSEAREVAKEGLRLARDADNISFVELSFVVLAAVAVDQGRAAAGARLLGAADMLRHRLGRDHAEAADRLFLDETTARIAAAMEADEYDIAFAEGRAMPLDDAVAYALEDPTDA
jgi:predicted ATPase